MKNNKKIVIFSISILFLIIISIFSYKFIFVKQGNVSDKLLVAFLDIGQGDSIFIQTPNDKQILIDGGPSKTILTELGKIMPFSDKTIDVVISTHPDSDHIGGLPFVLDSYQVSNIFYDGIVADTKTDQSFDQKMKIENAKIVKVDKEQRIVIDEKDNIYLDIIFPDRNSEGWETNTASIVAKLVYKNNSFLLTGDSPVEIERYLVEKYGEKYLDIDVLKLGHHGSRTSTSVDYLKSTTPALGIISAGRNNRYDHPHKEVLELLSLYKIPYLSTQNSGTIKLYSDGNDILYENKSVLR